MTISFIAVAGSSLISSAGPFIWRTIPVATASDFDYIAKFLFSKGKTLGVLNSDWAYSANDAANVAKGEAWREDLHQLSS